MCHARFACIGGRLRPIAIEFVGWARAAMANSALARSSVFDLPALQDGHASPCADGDDEEAGQDGATSELPKAKQGLACVGQILLAHRSGQESFGGSGLATCLDDQLECSTLSFHPLVGVV